MPNHTAGQSTITPDAARDEADIIANRVSRYDKLDREHEDAEYTRAEDGRGRHESLAAECKGLGITLLDDPFKEELGKQVPGSVLTYMDATGIMLLEHMLHQAKQRAPGAAGPELSKAAIQKPWIEWQEEEKVHTKRLGDISTADLIPQLPDAHTLQDMVTAARTLVETDLDEAFRANHSEPSETLINSLWVARRLQAVGSWKYALDAVRIARRIVLGTTSENTPAPDTGVLATLKGVRKINLVALGSACLLSTSSTPLRSDRDPRREALRQRAIRSVMRRELRERQLSQLFSDRGPTDMPNYTGNRDCERDAEVTYRHHAVEATSVFLSCKTVMPADDQALSQQTEPYRERMLNQRLDEERSRRLQATLAIMQPFIESHGLFIPKSEQSSLEALQAFVTTKVTDSGGALRNFWRLVRKVTHSTVYQGWASILKAHEDAIEQDFPKAAFKDISSTLDASQGDAQRVKRLRHKLAECGATRSRLLEIIQNASLTDPVRSSSNVKNLKKKERKKQKAQQGAVGSEDSLAEVKTLRQLQDEVALLSGAETRLPTGVVHAPPKDQEAELLEQPLDAVPSTRSPSTVSEKSEHGPWSSRGTPRRLIRRGRAAGRSAEAKSQTGAQYPQT